MQPPTRARVIGAALIAVLVLTCTNSFAQIFWVNASNSHLVRLDYPNGTPVVINVDANNFNGFTSLAVAKISSTTNLIVANAGGEILCYEDVLSDKFTGVANALASGIADPDGISVAINDDIFFVSTPKGESKTRAIYTIALTPNGTSCDAYDIDMAELFAYTTADALADTLTVRFDSDPLKRGDLLVLWRSPARVERYAADTEGLVQREFASTFIPTTCNDRPDNCFPSGVQPTGFDFDQFGNLLVATKQGSVYRFDRFGNLGGLDGKNKVIGDIFASGLELPDPTSGKVKVAVGIVDGKNTALISSTNGGLINVIEIRSDGRADSLNQIKEDAESPSGIDCVACDPDPTFGTTDVIVTGTGSQVLGSIKFPIIVESGLTLATDVNGGGAVFGFVDPREMDMACNYVADDQPFPDDPVCKLHFVETASGVEIERGIPGNEESIIPHYVRCVDGTCFLVVIESTVVSDGVVEGKGVEDHDPDYCDNPSARYKEARWYYAPDANDDFMLAEAPLFTDITKCGSDGWRRPRKGFSFFFRGRSTQPLDNPSRAVAESGNFSAADNGVIDAKLFVIDALLPDGLACASTPLRKKLARDLSRAIKFLDNGNAKRAQSHFSSFYGFLDGLDTDTDTVGCSDIRVELLARTESALDFLRKLVADSKRGGRP